MRALLSVNFLLSAAFVFLWNSGFIGAEAVLPNTGPLTLLFWRYGALTLLLFAGLLLLGRLRWPGWRAGGLAAFVGILAHGVWLGCVFYALDEEVPAGIVALVVALQPLLTGALSGWVTGERTPVSRWIGLFLGFAGVGLAVGGRGMIDSEGSLIGYLLPFGSVVAITVASLLQRRLSLHGEGRSLPVDLDLFYQSLGTFLAVAIPALLFESYATEWDLPFVIGLFWLVVGVSFGAYALMWVLIIRQDATRVASLFYLGPPTTMLMAWIAFGDKVLPHEWLALAIIAVGVAISQRNGHSKRSSLRG